jgi:hypothetical protein
MLEEIFALRATELEIEIRSAALEKLNGVVELSQRHGRRRTG